MGYWIRRKYRQIKNLIKWAPIIWKLYDFDWQSSLEVFIFQLKNIADFLESDKAYSMSAKDDAKRIRTILRLYDKTFGDEDYSMEYIDEMEALYGKDAFKMRFIPAHGKEAFGEFKMEYEFWDNAEEIRKKEIELIKKTQAKQEKAERLFWEMIKKDLKNFWD